jgi:hypothetical protein
MKTIIKTGILSGLFVLVSHPVYAIPFTNGDFSSGLSGWNDASFTGSVSESGGIAQLDTGAGADPFSAIIVQGDDGFFNFNSPISLQADNLYLNFDVQFADLGADMLESGASFFTDYLSVIVYDAVNFFDDLVLDPGVDVTTGSDWQRINLDVSSLIGHDVALSFELNDQDDGRDSRVLLDNISFTSTPETIDTIAVPEPNTIFLFAVGVLLLVTTRQRKSL